MYKTVYAACVPSIVKDAQELCERLISVWCKLPSLLWTTPSTSRGIVCLPVSTLKADIYNITDDYYSQSNNVEMAAL